MSYDTINCEECKYYKEIDGLKTCGKTNKFLKINCVGCYSGEKQYACGVCSYFWKGICKKHKKYVRQNEIGCEEFSMSISC